MADLLPKDPIKRGLYWCWHAEKCGWDHFWWNTKSWLSVLGASATPRELGREGYSDPRYIPTPDETALLSANAARTAIGFGALVAAFSDAQPTPATLDDRQAPTWTLKAPGVLVHRGGRHFVHWMPGWATVAAVFSSKEDDADPCSLGEFPTPEEAKAAAETHAAWCEEFGYE